MAAVSLRRRRQDGVGGDSTSTSTTSSRSQSAGVVALPSPSPSPSIEGHWRRRRRLYALVPLLVLVAFAMVGCAHAEAELLRQTYLEEQEEGTERGLLPLGQGQGAAAAAPGVASNVAVDMVCDGMVLDDLLGELEDLPECSITYARFYDRIREPRFNSETLSEQTRKLNDFCKSPCGKFFNEKVTAWRDWCASPDGKMVPIHSNGNTYRMAGFIAVFGCTVSPTVDSHPLMPEDAGEGITTSYCATMAMGAMAGNPTLHGEAAEKAICSYYQSCCFGMDYALLRLTRPLNLPGIEARCPGATKAFNTQCAGAAVSNNSGPPADAPPPPPAATAAAVPAPAAAAPAAAVAGAEPAAGAAAGGAPLPAP